jgi:hypothetical protein
MKLPFLIEYERRRYNLLGRVLIGLKVVGI